MTHQEWSYVKDIIDDLEHYLIYGFYFKKDCRMSDGVFKTMLFWTKVTYMTESDGHIIIDLDVINRSFKIKIDFSKKIFSYGIAAEGSKSGRNQLDPLGSMYHSFFEPGERELIEEYVQYARAYLHKCTGIKIYNLDIDLLRYW